MLTGAAPTRDVSNRKSCMTEQPSLGLHWIVELFGCSPDVLNDLPAICERMKQFAANSNLTLLQLTSHQFEPHGVTAVGLLSESHFSVHTWPEHGYVAIDIFTCGGDAAFPNACQKLSESFGAEHHATVVIKRGDLAGRQIRCSDQSDE